MIGGKNKYYLTVGVNAQIARAHIFYHPPALVVDPVIRNVQRAVADPPVKVICKLLPDTDQATE